MEYFVGGATLIVLLAAGFYPEPWLQLTDSATQALPPISSMTELAAYPLLSTLLALPLARRVVDSMGPACRMGSVDRAWRHGSDLLLCSMLVVAAFDRGATPVSSYWMRPPG